MNDNEIQSIVAAADLTQPEPQETTIKRDAPDPDEARAALVSEWTQKVQNARQYWYNKSFRRMVEDMRFVAGRQWNGVDLTAKDEFNEAPEDRYVANITLRHVQQRTASIYGKNPKIVARTKRRLLSRLWDGTSQALMAAMTAVRAGDLQAQAILADAQQALRVTTINKKVADTLQILFEHEIDEQPVPFKVAMKGTVRRGLTTGVGWVKLGYERVMDLPPDVDARIETVSAQLAAMERLAADKADGEIADTDPEAEQLRLLLEELRATPQIVVREGLRLTFPGSTSIIPDTDCQQLRGFVGAGWVAEEFYLTADRIKEIYNVDVAAGGADITTEGRPKAYERVRHGEFRPASQDTDQPKDAFHCVWEIYNRNDGLVYTICEGYKDFLLPPGAPDIYLERFYPWFPFVVNEVYDEDSVFPIGDVRLMRDMQMELNRARQGLREHRVAGRPRTFGRKGVLSDEDRENIQEPIAHSHIELDGLSPGEKIEDVLQPFRGSPIDPALYDPSPVFEDYLRTTGNQEAQLGGVSGATATETAIAEGARTTSNSATVDDLDEFLSELARAAGQVLLMETRPEKVMEVVGPGAVWPEFSRDQIAREIYLDIEAASTGRPNKQAEIQNAQAIFPLLMQIPGIPPEWMANELVKRLDDRLDITEAFAAAMPSVQMMNRQAQMSAVAPGADPNAQGPEGAGNAPSTSPEQVNAAPRPGVPGQNPAQPGPRAA